MGINKPKLISRQFWRALVGTDEQTIEYHVINKILAHKAVGEKVPEWWVTVLDLKGDTKRMAIHARNKI